MIDAVVKIIPVVFRSDASLSLVTSVSFDFATAAVVSFVLVLLGMAAGLLLMVRILNGHVRKGSE